MDKKHSHKTILKELAWGQLRSHKGRNCVMSIAVMLTAMLLSFVFTAGFSFLTTMENSVQASPGPMEDGGVIGTAEQFEEIQKMDMVEWADFVQICSAYVLKNDLFAGIQTHLYAPDENFYLHNEIHVLEGEYPQKENDIMISDTLAKRLMIEQIGKEFDLQVMIESESGPEEKIMTMNICGIYNNPLRNISDIYEEIYTMPEFVNRYNPELRRDQNFIYVKLNNLNPFALKTDVYQVLVDIKEAVGANGIVTRHYNNFIFALIAILPILLVVLLIMLSGYFLIYNVFSISLAMDVAWLGLMKTIGTTHKQLNYIYRYQISVLSVLGMCGGIILGYVMGAFLGPGILAMTSFALFYENTNPLWVILFTVAFTKATTWIGVSKVVRKVAALSAIEAAKYVPHHKKKIVTVMSFALSGIIFIAVGNAVFGYQIERKVERFNQEDCRIWHAARFWELEEAYQPISVGAYESIEKLPFVKHVDIIYKGKTRPDEIDYDGIKYYEPFLAEVSMDTELEAELEAMRRNNIDITAWNRLENGNVKLEIMGITASRLEKELAYVDILEGAINVDLFAQGNYILYQTPRFYKNDGEVPEEDKVHAGDLLSLRFYDDKKDCYIPREMKVMAVIEQIDPYGTGNINNSNIVMVDDAFQEIYSGYEENIAAMEVSTKYELGKEEIEAVREIIRKENNVQLYFDSRYQSYEEHTAERKTFIIIGLFLSAVLGMIGISNLLNTLVMDTLFRKEQIAVLQSIGMTKAQLRRMLFFDYMKIGFAAMVIILLAGRYVAVAIASSSTFTGFSENIFVKEAIGIVLFIIILSGGLACILTKWLNRKTIVERLGILN
ncbi:MAG: FtsX-like permease family protein [Lachnospiraceae bacterium]|nr:FtsX-like permease family protein [Lachnospiraceae bacterium]